MKFKKRLLVLLTTITGIVSLCVFVTLMLTPPDFQKTWENFQSITQEKWQDGVAMGSTLNSWLYESTNGHWPLNQDGDSQDPSFLLPGSKLDLVQYYHLNVSLPDGSFQLQSPLSKKQIDSINDSKKLPWEKSDLSPSKNPWSENTNEPESIVPLVRPSKKSPTRKARAAFISLVRNEELKGIIQSMKELEEKFNSKFNYPWIFFNDKEFTKDFKEMTQAATKAKCQYVTLDPKDWLEPDWIDTEKALRLNNKMSSKNHVQYAAMASYHRMCRWNSGPFYTNPALKDYDYYWRVEPNVHYYCSIDYDVFAYMQDNNKDYGFTVNVYDSPHTIKSLWPTTVSFFKQHPEYMHPNSSRQWLLQKSRKDHNDYTGGYSTCHFWSNFEIGRLDFFRSKQYQEYFNYLDSEGGFFYERWGDAPVHSIALGLMTDKSRIHWFKDIGYNHLPYSNCPKSKKCKGCVAGKFSPWSDLDTENCIQEWFKVAGTG
ncbi:uncharacterized protein SAPINGB_P003911 [Magnusiomyces paraingens]|uniref:Glycosyltransferase family 15 protein n=1 Tax=Magnusiomyces paraingens TaxID=2606893 RepID=A0A5E8BU07_9ASCO|nr:uncharacterized protein SAPINGB_P003911 [Saprochaete ingens]VVT54109.1 unnamed protein product [Saprochaete ingens]